MEPELIREVVDEHTAAISIARRQIKHIQDTVCQHIGLVGKFRGDSGYDYHSYWVEFKCPVCNKQWVEDQEEFHGRTKKSLEGFTFTEIK